MEAATFNLPEKSVYTFFVFGDSRNGMVGCATRVCLILLDSFQLFPQVVATFCSLIPMRQVHGLLHICPELHVFTLSDLATQEV